MVKKVRLTPPGPPVNRRDRDMDILNMWFDGKTRRVIAKTFGLSESHITVIVNREANVDYICNDGSKVFVPCCLLE